MAQRNLREATAACERMPDVAASLGVDAGEVAGWRRAGDTMLVPYDDDLGVHPQCSGFTDFAEWNFAATPPEEYPLLLHRSVLRPVPQASRQATGDR